MKRILANIALFLTLSGTALSASKYRVDVKPPASATKGKAAVALVHVEGTGAFKINVGYPAKLTLTAPAGVQLSKTQLTQADAVKLTREGIDFEIRFTSADARIKAFTGELKFAVATDMEAMPVAEKIAFSVTVK